MTMPLCTKQARWRYGVEVKVGMQELECPSQSHESDLTPLNTFEMHWYAGYVFRAISSQVLMYSEDFNCSQGQNVPILCSLRMRKVFCFWNLMLIEQSVSRFMYLKYPGGCASRTWCPTYTVPYGQRYVWISDYLIQNQCCYNKFWSSGMAFH